MDQQKDFFDRKSIHNQKVLLRLDLNVPLKEGAITDHSRIAASLPSIRSILKLNPKKLVIISSRAPKTRTDLTKLGTCEKNISSPYLVKLFFWPTISLKPNHPSCVLSYLKTFAPFLAKQKTLLFAQKLASLGDLFIMDAFATIHRAHASTSTCTKLLPAIKVPYSLENFKPWTMSLRVVYRPVWRYRRR